MTKDEHLLHRNKTSGGQEKNVKKYRCEQEEREYKEMRERESI